MPDEGADPGLIAAWLTARSIARGLPLPVPDHGGLRVDTGLPTETRRFVFARPVQGLVELGRTITDPLVPLKLCADRAVMRAVLPDGWLFAPQSYVMVSDTATPSIPPSAGYRLMLQTKGTVTFATVSSDGGEIAATGRAVEQGGVFIFDQIVTDAGHRRRGLGSALMSALAQMRRDPASRFALVATKDGRALYEALGWRIHAPYSTAAWARGGPQAFA